MFRNIGRLVKLAIVLLFANALYQFVPPYLHYQQFKDAVREVGLFSKNVPDAKIVDDVLALAEKYSVPIERGDIDVRHDTAYTYIDVAWSQDIRFAPFYTYPWHFDATAHVMSNLGAGR